ncbi:glycosyltransferase involved in cell wall biosynthesis [Roseiarcus fermentans]|uniref:Glycosyltransferase involved in cell wall biosynthesis n=1 Tax=Roseiarcus fermentans TaxID=1473586 RepID=A0A366EXI2_9HYPH|nr:glycosyltransferase family 4 protein [Roseiarcus fermentans]RBP07112.1 glycosyltransferase involved in cell wall biosynthesis [Roseiarcus fermentans]
MTTAASGSWPLGVFPGSSAAAPRPAAASLDDGGPARILMVSARFFPLAGGVETHVYETARRLAARGLRVDLLTTDTTGALPARDHLDGVSIIRVPAWPRGSDVRFAPRIYDVIAAGRWDIVHVQGYHTFVAPIAMDAARRAGLPFVLTFHSGGHSSPLRRAVRGAQRLALRPLVNGAARLIGVSRYEADFFSRTMGVARHRFHVVPNGGELPRPAVGRTRRSGDRLIVSIGRLERYKGHHRAIEAMPHILSRLPGARLRVLGEGPYERPLRRLVARLGLADAVTIGGIPSGDRRAMADLLASADLVVLFSDYEAHPVAVMEALALGRKIVVSEAAGLAEIVAEGRARGAPPACRAEERARLMVEMMEEGPIPEAVALPTWEDCVDSLLSIYRDALGRERDATRAAGV